MNRPLTWFYDNTRADRWSAMQHFSTSHAYYWWPRRKEDEGHRGEETSDWTGETMAIETTRDTLPLESASLGISRAVPRRIHILGAGNLGKFVAHALAGIPNRPPMTLLFRRPGLMTSWKEQGCSIQLSTNGMVEARRGYEVELVPYGDLPPKEVNKEESLPRVSMEATAASDQQNEEDADKEPIYNLIVSVKAPETVRALYAVAHRLHRESTILFLQNGMGMVDEVNSIVFPDEATRPNYVVGVISHGIYANSSFSIVHAGMGTIALGLLPRRSGQASTVQFAGSTGYLLRTMTRTPVLAAVGFPPMDLLQLQIEKVAINAIINPLTVMFDCKNGELLSNFSITRVMRLLLAEISLVIRSLPELRSVPNVNMRFAPDRLEEQVVTIASQTAGNVSSMLQDIQNGRRTEIDYINGYIIRRGEDLGVKCVMNYMLSHMVKGKQQGVSKKDSDLLPVLPFR